MATRGSTGSPAGLPVDNPTKPHWLKEPSKILLGHRTTKTLPQTANIVNVGSGITSAFAAHCLKEKAPDLKVVMLEAREACSGATGRAHPNCKLGQHFCNLFYSLDLFNTSKDEIEKKQKEHPDIGENIAVVVKGSGRLEELRVASAEGVVVQQNAVASCFNLQTNTPVTGLMKVDIPAESSIPHPQAPKAASGGWAVCTTGGDISARHVILATNAYTSHLLPQLADIIVPVKGQVSSLKPPPPPPPPTQRDQQQPPNIGHTFYFLSDLADRRDDYLIQRPPPGAELIYGGGRIHAEGRGLGVWDDSVIDEPVARYLREELRGLMDLSMCEEGKINDDHGILKSKRHLEPTFEWADIMGFSRDGGPWVGPVPESAGGGDGLWLCVGYSGGGMPNAALCTKALVDMIVPGNKDGLADPVDLPPEYLLTQDRLEKANTLPTVEEQDKKGSFMFECDT